MTLGWDSTYTRAESDLLSFQLAGGKCLKTQGGGLEQSRQVLMATKPKSLLSPWQALVFVRSLSERVHLPQC